MIWELTEGILTEYCMLSILIDLFQEGSLLEGSHIFVGRSLELLDQLWL